MAKYTTEVRTICESLWHGPADVGVEQIINNALPYIFDFAFPLFDEAHREELETKIIKHYYFREIGCETVGQWKFRLDTTLNEIMPYYNEMYRSAEFLKDPLVDTDFTRTVDGRDTEASTEKNTSQQTVSTTSTESITDNSTRNNTDNGSRKQMFSDTPQGGMNNMFDAGYATEVRQDDNNDTSSETINGSRESDGSGSSTSSGSFDTTGNKNGTHQTVEKVKGKMSNISMPKLTSEYRKAVMNVDMAVIDALADLFMLIY